MKLKIYNEEAGKPEQELCLRLRQTAQGVLLSIVYPDSGDRRTQGDILRINNDGSLHLFTCIESSHGLQLDSQARIMRDK